MFFICKWWCVGGPSMTNQGRSSVSDLSFDTCDTWLVDPTIHCGTFKRVFHFSSTCSSNWQLFSCFAPLVHYVHICSLNIRSGQDPNGKGACYIDHNRWCLKKSGKNSWRVAWHSFFDRFISVPFQVRNQVNIIDYQDLPTGRCWTPLNH